MRLRPALPLLLLALLAATPRGAQAERVGIAATVNDEVITLSDVESRVKLYLSGAPGTPPPDVLKRMRAQVLDKMIDEKLELGEAKSAGVSVSEQQLADGFAEIAKQNHFTPDEFKQRLTASGVRLSTLNDQLRAEYAWSQVIRRRLRPQIAISESEIDNAMDLIARNSTKPQYRVAEIYLAVSTPAQDATVRADAEKMIQQITGGAHFSSVAREFSQAPGAAQGGDLGWIQEGQLDPKLDDALRHMQTGQLSPPVRTEGGYHILFLRDMQKPGAAPAAAPSAPAATPLTLHLKQIVIGVDPSDPAPVVAAKTARAQSLKTEVLSCADMDARAKDFPGDGSGDLGAAALDILPPPVRLAVENLKDGALSDPVRTDKGIAVFMVCGREGAAAAAPLEAATPPPAVTVPDKTDQAAREQVANKIGMQRLDQMQERYLRDLRATAFIEKRL